MLYEMLTGRRAFGGDEVADMLAAILRGEPDLGALPPGVPLAIRLTVQRCLEKDPGNGFATSETSVWRSRVRSTLVLSETASDHQLGAAGF